MSLWIDSQPIEYFPAATEGEDDDLQVIIRSVYRQVLGNAHVMESDRLADAESQLRNGDYTVRDFVRAIAMSDLYRSLFFEPSSAYRFIELNFKHFLGRAPLDQAEIAEHVRIYNEQGYEAEINSYIDSDEYVTSFGDYVIPYCRGTNSEVGFKTSVFARTLAIARGNATNDAPQAPKLVAAIAGNTALAIKALATGSGTADNTSKRFSIKTVSSSAAAAMNRLSNKEYVVDFSRLSSIVQSLHKQGAKITSITEVA